MIALVWKIGGRWTLKDTAVACMTVIAGALTLALALAYLAPPRLEASLLSAEISADSGFAYIAPISLRLPVGYVIVADGVGNSKSNLQLRENGQLLGPAHSGHVDIRESGKGRYSHWRERLWFSASDSSDPRSNGRSYSISVRASVHPLIFPAVVLFDVLVLIAARRRLISDPRFRRILANTAMLAALVLAALIAAGAFGRVNEDAGATKDVALVVATLLHALLGCVILVVQWVAGAGLARLLLGAQRATLANVLLLGFPLSLPLAAVLAVLTLSLPYGLHVATVVWALCCLPLGAWRPAGGELAKFAKVGLALLPFAIGFGCWMGLHWHGPTETLAASPTGDLVYYSTSIVSLSTHLYPYLNLGYERELFGIYFNLLFPLLGAASDRVLTLDPFLFITAGGAATFVLLLGLVLYLYIQGTGIFVRKAHITFSSLILALAIIVANRYPYWIVESIPMTHAVALTIAVVYWARKNDAYARLFAFVLAVVGSALTKVVGVAVLAPFVAASAVPQFFLMSRRIRIAAIAAALVAAVYAALLLFRVGPSMFAFAPLGPASVSLVVRYDADFWTALPFALRDISAVLLAAAAFLLFDWIVAGAIAFGFLLFLIYPFLFHFDMICAVIIFGLTACDHPVNLWKYRLVVLGALLLALPAVLLTDPAGVSSGLVWIVCVGSAVWVAISGEKLTQWTGTSRAAAATVVLLALCLIAVGRGHLAITSGGQSGVLNPQVRQIWLTVKQRTPTDALIFTDQTGIEPTLLGGWNTYAFIGGRQIFASFLYMNSATRLNRQRLFDVLAENEAVLKGELLPTQLKLRSQYSSYFAVVSRDRNVPNEWVKIFENERYVLYRIPSNR
jgi:hypothetical protein